MDSNVAIKSDPLSQDVEDDYDLALRFQQLAAEGTHRLLVHPSSLTDFARDPDVTRSGLRKRSFGRYSMLGAPPARSARQVSVLGEPVPKSNDVVDQDLLAAVLGDAVAFLVTQDDGIHKKARRLGVEDRVLRLSDAIATIEGLFVRLPRPPPSVERRKAHELDLSDHIWDSLRADYEGFDKWLVGARREQRDALVIGEDPARLAAVCLLKDEPGGEYAIAGPLLKISTFKVSPEYSGNKYGELLLKAVFDQCATSQVAGIYVTVFEKHAELLDVFAAFGFDTIDERSSLANSSSTSGFTVPSRRPRQLAPWTFMSPSAHPHSRSPGPNPIWFQSSLAGTGSCSRTRSPLTSTPRRSSQQQQPSRDTPSATPCGRRTSATPIPAA